jgi:hypothetical protein
VRKSVGAAHFVVPRVWLVVIVIALLAPWAFLAWKLPSVSGGPVSRESSPTTAQPPGDVVLGKVGPWGQLEYWPIVISPPLEYVADVEQPETPTLKWYLPAATREELEQFFQGAGLGASETAAVLSTASPAPQIKGIVLSPSRDLVEGLDPRTRRIIYDQLQGTPLNEPQRRAFRFYGTFEQWTETSRLPTDVLNMVRKLSYQRDDFVRFSDLTLVTTQISAPDVRKRLVKTLLRDRTALIKLRIPEGGDTDAIAEYWGRGGRRTDIRPLLDSMPSGSTIDIVHLLPTFARLHLYRYPRIYLKSLDQPQTQNCFWSSLNFFNDPADDRFLDQREVSRTIKTDYYLIHDNLQLGDLVMLTDPNGEFFHACVYLADQQVFTKNGQGISSPWVVMPIDRLKGYFTEYPEYGVEYYRRNGL